MISICADVGCFDTVLCFSLMNHLNSTAGIVNTIRRSTRKVLYFEGHANTSMNDYAYLLNEDFFSRIDLVGYSRDEILKTSATRPVFRCVPRHQELPEK